MDQQSASASFKIAAQQAHPFAFFVDVVAMEGVLTGLDCGAGDDMLRIERVACDSREVVPGTLFICKGAAFKEEYLASAIEAGAVAYVSERAYPAAKVPSIIVSDIRAAMAALADSAYSHPSAKLSICAFTGTKGKTTSAFYLKGILDARAEREGRSRTPIISTILTDDGTGECPAHLTTPEPLELEQNIANAVVNGAHDLVMEASSQALKYGRVAHVEFAVGAFTNISEDHISPIEHPDFEDYFSSKLRIFEQSRAAVVNLDMDFCDRVLKAAEASEKLITYALENPAADVYLSGIACAGGRLSATLHTPDFTCELSLPTAARFNASNALGAICCALAVGATQDDIVRGLAYVSVPGRMEVIRTAASDELVGIVDYAHNGVSLEALLTSVREGYPGRELTVVFGSTGVKGLDRREDMGKVAGRLADRIFITEDDAGTEDVASICNTIAHFVEGEGNHSYTIELDRERAIERAIESTARPGVVVVAGKGHERRQLRPEGPVPYAGDAAIVRRALESFCG